MGEYSRRLSTSIGLVESSSDSSKLCWILLFHSSRWPSDTNHEFLLHNELDGNTIGEERYRNEFRQ